MNENYQQIKTDHFRPGKYQQKLLVLKRMIVEYVHENAALVDEIEEVQANVLMRKEERKFLLKKLCEFEPQVALEIQNAAKGGNLSSVSINDIKRNKRKISDASSVNSIEKRISKPKKLNVKSSKKKQIQPIPVDNIGKPIFPLELGSLKIHSLGEIIHDRKEFHSENAFYPVGYVSTRIYGSLKDPTSECVYTCKISDQNNVPIFEIACDEEKSSIIGDSPDICHSILLQKINDALALNVVSTRPRGEDFFGLKHPTVLYLMQSSSGTRKCRNYKWIRFEISKNADSHKAGDCNDPSVSYELLQKNINLCKYKMAPDILKNPNDYVDSV